MGCPKKLVDVAVARAGCYPTLAKGGWGDLGIWMPLRGRQ